MGLNSTSRKGGMYPAYKSVVGMRPYLELKLWVFLWPPGRINHVAELPVPRENNHSAETRNVVFKQPSSQQLNCTQEIQDWDSFNQIW